MNNNTSSSTIMTDKNNQIRQQTLYEHFLDLKFNIQAQFCEIRNEGPLTKSYIQQMDRIMKYVLELLLHDCPSFIHLDIVLFADQYTNDLFTYYPFIESANSYIDLLETIMMGVFTIASTCITNYPEISPEKKDVGNRILSLIMKFQSKYAIKIINPGDTNTNLGKKVLQQLIPFLNTVVNIVYDSDTVQDYTLFYLKFKDKGIPLPNEFINKLKILNPSIFDADRTSLKRQRIPSVDNTNHHNIISSTTTTISSTTSSSSISENSSPSSFNVEPCESFKEARYDTPPIKAIKLIKQSLQEYKNIVLWVRDKPCINGNDYVSFFEDINSIDNFSASSFIKKLIADLKLVAENYTELYLDLEQRFSELQAKFDSTTITESTTLTSTTNNDEHTIIIKSVNYKQLYIDAHILHTCMCESYIYGAMNYHAIGALCTLHDAVYRKEFGKYFMHDVIPMMMPNYCSTKLVDHEVLCANGVHLINHIYEMFAPLLKDAVSHELQAYQILLQRKSSEFR